MGGCGSKVLNFLVKIHIKLFVLQTYRNVLKHMIQKWGGHIWPFHDALRPHRFSTVRDRQKKMRFLLGLFFNTFPTISLPTETSWDMCDILARFLVEQIRGIPGISCVQ